MDFDLTWLLLGPAHRLRLGWLASRLDLRQLRIENRQAPKAYFRGLNFLLNEQQDQAIDAFIEAVQNDPDTSELHFALGNLFRRRGEYERAVRVHEHLLSRGDLSAAPTAHRAQHALALDFLKAGLLDRAEEALRKLEGTPTRKRRCWPCWPSTSARATGPGHRDRRKLGTLGSHGSFSGRQAHYLCEQAGARPWRRRHHRGAAAGSHRHGAGRRARDRPGQAAKPARPATQEACKPCCSKKPRRKACRCRRLLANSRRPAASAATRSNCCKASYEHALARRAGRHRQAGKRPGLGAPVVREAPGARGPRWSPPASGSPAKSWSTSSSHAWCSAR
jgi:tetratricopeptide (TPR) repeat protein